MLELSRFPPVCSVPVFSVDDVLLVGNELVAEDDDDDVLTLSEEGSLEDDDVSSEDEDDDVDERTLEVVSRELIEEESPSSSLTV